MRSEEPPPARPDVTSEAGADKPKSRAGRNLPAAITVGLLLGGSVLASLFLWRPAFVVVAILATSVGVWEMVRAVETGGSRPPMIPLIAGNVGMLLLAWFQGAAALPLGLFAVALAVLLWGLARGAEGYQRNFTVAMFIASYVPLLASFAVLLARPEDGSLRVVAALTGVVISDTGGYITGVLFGKHPMSPTVSPKKSWEGFAGSVGLTALSEAGIIHGLFGVQLWQGALFGVAVSIAAVLGDLAESLIKRDLGVKDMSSLLPGHGGMMDRLDSILFAAPTAYAVLLLVAPVAN